MLKKKQQKVAPVRIDTLVGENVVVDGNLHFRGGMRIEGKVNGDIRADKDQPSTLILSDKAVVKGSVVVDHLISNGIIQGSVFATELLELQDKSRIEGEVHYKALDMQLGAVIDGQLTHSAESETESEKVVPLKAGTADS